MNKKIKGDVWKFGDNVDTDQIIPAEYLVMSDPKELGRHAFEKTRPDFAEEVKEGDVIVAGSNFGCGSSREQAPAVLKQLGVRIIIAESFARIFFRNCINLGILLIELKDTSGFKQGDKIEVTGSSIKNISRDKTYNFIPLSDFLKKIIDKGGLVNYLK